jgi:dTDP-glucose 4,6-dehydratase
VNILFFGGTGFFGKAFLNYISCLKNHNINTLTIAGRNAENFLSLNSGFEKLPNVNFINADILGDLNHLREINYTHVIHAAADSTNVTGLNPLNRYSQIVDGTKKCIRFY